MNTGSQFMRFGIVGVLNTAVQFLVFVLLFRVLHVPMILASGLGYIAGIVNSYLLNRTWTFKVRRRRETREFLRFVAVNILAMGVNLGTLKFLVATWAVVPEVAQILAIGASLVVNFAGNKWWTFRESPTPSQRYQADEPDPAVLDSINDR